MLLFYRVYISQQVNNCDRGVMAARIVDRLISICARDAFQQHSAALGCQTGWPTPQHDGSIARSIDEMRNVVVVRPQQTVNPCPYTIYTVLMGKKRQITIAEGVLQAKVTLMTSGHKNVLRHTLRLLVTLICIHV